MWQAWPSLLPHPFLDMQMLTSLWKRCLAFVDDFEPPKRWLWIKTYWNTRFWGMNWMSPHCPRPYHFPSYFGVSSSATCVTHTQMRDNLAGRGSQVRVGTGRKNPSWRPRFPSQFGHKWGDLCICDSTIHMCIQSPGACHPTSSHHGGFQTWHVMALIEGSLEVKLPTIWTDEKQSRAEAERRERLEDTRSEKRKSQKKEDADARKGRKVAKHFFSNDLWLRRVEK